MRKINILLNCDAQTAMGRMKNMAGKPRFSLLASMLTSKPILGKFKDNTFKIWPKDYSKSPAFIKGEINNTDGGSLIKGKIYNQKLIKIPNWLFVIAILLSPVSFGLLIYSLNSNSTWIYQSVLFLAVISGINIVFIFQYISDFEEDELIKFINTIFEEHIESIVIA